MIIPKIKIINHPEILKIAAKFDQWGPLAISSNKLVHVKVDDAYIHELYPLLDQSIQKPDYFNNGKAGAHISVIYPDEKVILEKSDIGMVHPFIITGLMAAEIASKMYYALMIESPTLLQIRRKYQLPDQLNFKGYAIGFHITIGILQIKK